MRRCPGTCLAWLGIAALLVSVGCQGVAKPAAPSGKISLFNGKDLSGWKLVVSDPNADVHKVWTVRAGVVRCEGRPTGYMRTTRAYQNYRLHLEWRWVDKPANSGVLVHAGGPDKVWPRCIECQLQAGNAGDLVLIGDTGITVDGRDMRDATKPYVILAKRQSSSEKVPGQWNTYDIVCSNDTLSCSVNGLLQNRGEQATVTAGWIGLQSEGGPIEFRNITLEPVR